MTKECVNIDTERIILLLNPPVFRSIVIITINSSALFNENAMQ